MPEVVEAPVKPQVEQVVIKEQPSPNKIKEGVSRLVLNIKDRISGPKPDPDDALKDVVDFKEETSVQVSEGGDSSLPEKEALEVRAVPELSGEEAAGAELDEPQDTEDVAVPAEAQLTDEELLKQRLERWNEDGKLRDKLFRQIEPRLKADIATKGIFDLNKGKYLDFEASDKAIERDLDWIAENPSRVSQVVGHILAQEDILDRASTLPGLNAKEKENIDSMKDALNEFRNGLEDRGVNIPPRKSFSDEMPNDDTETAAVPIDPETKYKYAYHGTPLRNMPSIAENGLTLSGLQSKEQGTIFFNGYDDRNGYAGGLGMLYRTHMSHIPEENGTDIEAVGSTRTPIPPEFLEYSLDGGDSWRHDFSRFIKQSNPETPEEKTPDIIKTKQEVDIGYGGKHEIYEAILPSGLPAHVIFKDREGDMNPGVISDKYVVLLGKDPKWVPQATFEGWKKQFDGVNNARLERQVQPQHLDVYSQNGGLTFIVDQDAEAIAEMALILGTKDSQIGQFHHEARTFHYSEELLQQIDNAIAARVLFEDGTIIPANVTHDGEALLLASIMRDEQAKAILAKKGDIYRSLEEKNAQDRVDKNHALFEGVEQHTNDPSYKEAAPLRIGELVTVHTTKYYPEFDQRIGKWVIKSTYDATGGYQPRVTVHAALNHIVNSHAGGQWEEMPIVVIAPLEDMIKENGLPCGIQSVDTFWELNPGQDLVLPESTRILAPGPVESESIQNTAPTNRLNHRAIAEGRHPVNYRSYDTSNLQKLRLAYDREKLFFDKNLTPEERSLQIGLDEQVRVEVREVGEQKKAATREVVEQMGFQYRKDIHDSDFDENLGRLYSYRLSLLAGELGLPQDDHSNSPSGEVEDSLYQSLAFKADNKEYISAENRETLLELLVRDWGNISPKIKRMLWTYGIL